MRTKRHAPAVPASPEGVGLDAVTKTYGEGETAVRALDEVTLSIPTGRFVAIMGPSGSGKSTLLQCAAGLREPDAGEVRIGGRRTDGLPEEATARLRRTEVGFVFQHYNLVDFLTVTENVELPLRAAGRRARSATIASAIAEVGLAGRASHRPAQLSGGEQQRAAIARALVTEPTVLFADEPTGALDSAAATRVLGLLRDTCDRRSQTIAMVTHDPVAASWADEVVFMADGRLAGRLAAPDAAEVAARLAALGDRGPGAPAPAPARDAAPEAVAV